MLESWEEKELQELIDARFEGTISPQQAAKLERWVCENDDACRFYVRYNAVHGMLLLENAQDELCDSFHPVPTTESFDSLSDVKSKREVPVLGFLGDFAQQSMSFLFKSNVFSLLVAIGLPGIILLVLGLNVMRQPEPVTAVATLSRTYECHWGKSDIHPVVGAELMPGQGLNLRAGLAEITFADGATVLLEGPSTFYTDGRAKGYLHVGRLVAKATKGAEGFTIQTPSAMIVDLGTEFGVSVSDNGAAEAHVFQGEVEVATRPADQATPLKKSLKAGQAARVTADKRPKLVAMATNDSHFARHVPGTLAEPTIFFAHRGSTDPTSEGWQLVKPDRDAVNKADIELGPVEENGTAAWSFHKKGEMAYTENSAKTEYYTILKDQGLDPKLIDEAKRKGWVMRAKLWISDRSARVGEQLQGLSTFHYCDGEQDWGLHPTLNSNGDQLLLLVAPDSSLKAPGTHGGAIPVPNSRNRYVDYEVRYHPDTKSADVFINGRRVATGFSRFRGKVTPLLRFGTTSWKLACDVRFALFEWGILRETEKAPNAMQVN